MPDRGSGFPALVLAGAKDDVVTNGVCTRADGVRSLVCPGIVVNSNVTEVVAKV
ncbi:hypothetical protein LVJ94_24695 [Pendulispora rubella]|uniref:Uncharacterized protein n=1 Tax=Pendulispora rubella TaxID=2741070 RepID=A0ABZ2LHJ0_9BACT